MASETLYSIIFPFVGMTILLLMVSCCLAYHKMCHNRRRLSEARSDSESPDATVRARLHDLAESSNEISHYLIQGRRNGISDLYAGIPYTIQMPSTVRDLPPAYDVVTTIPASVSSGEKKELVLRVPSQEPSPPPTYSAFVRHQPKSPFSFSVRSKDSNR